VPINCTARQVHADDYNKFDYILAMDQAKYAAPQEPRTH
jgi:protein-tyrosine-phosphatase